MGLQSTASTVTLTARLTPIGRKKLMSGNGNTLITKFAFGDSDANYYSSQTLASGQVPSLGGNIGSDSGTTNSVFTNVIIKSPLIASASGSIYKLIQPSSISINTQYTSLGQTGLTGTSLGQYIINRNSGATDSLVNLYYTFGLPLNTTDDIVYTGRTFANGGYSDTAISAVSQTRIAIIAIPNANYGELIDGKQLKVTLSAGTATTYTLYSTFQKTNVETTVQDANYIDGSANLAQYGSNIALLFSDDIMRPNGGDSTLSWATGFGSYRAFSVGNKRLFNLTTTSQLSLTADTAVGIAYLDKGLIVLTHSTLVNIFNTDSTATTVTYNSVSTKVSQVISCIAERGEFMNSTNRTFIQGNGPNNIPRISEVGLYDKDNNLIAYAKSDKHITKNINQLIALSVEISL